MARWPDGSVVRWFGGSVVRWFGGSVVRWFGGSVVRWFGGSNWPHQASSDADPESRKSVTLSWVRSTDAGHAVDTAQERASRTGTALRSSGTTASTALGAEQGGDGDGHGVCRHGLDAREVALVHLLEPAGVVELDHLDVQRIGEVRHGRIVEGEVPVLPDPQAAQVGGGAQQLGVAGALGLRLGEASM